MTTNWESDDYYRDRAATADRFRCPGCGATWWRRLVHHLWH
jgi:hypothetical protein